MNIQARRPADRPIGVFDSGLGGLTVLSALARRMPQEPLVYFGDTAHLPYGTKSEDAVGRYSLACARILAESGIKALVVACNTASALALPKIREAVRVPVVGVILPGARAAAQVSRNGTIGIIGTEATIASGAYTRAVRGFKPRARVIPAACPLFVPLAEEGWWEDPVTEAVARRYLAALRRAGMDTLILGCTHYPLLKRVIGRVAGPGVALIDSAEQTAIEAEDLLISLKLRRTAGRGERRFMVSDGPKRFGKFARLLLGRAVAVDVRRSDP